MSISAFSRDAVFIEIQRLVEQYNAVQSQADPETRWYVEDDLAALIIKLNAETQRAIQNQRNTTCAADNNSTLLTAYIENIQDFAAAKTKRTV